MSKSKKPKDKKLTEEELANLTGFFDVLIQMDLEQKRKANETKPAAEKKSKNS